MNRIGSTNVSENVPGQIDEGGYLNAHIAKQTEEREWIWRYMDLAKFLNLLNTSSLYFPTASMFDDKREGLIHHPRTIAFFEAAKKMLEKRSGLTPTELNERQIALREFYLISCWNRSPVESVALWKMYTSGHNGVAIRTTVSALSAELNGKVSNIRAQDVIYPNVITSNGSEEPMEPFFRKTSEWQFENEYRLLIDLTQDERFKTESLRESVGPLSLAFSVPVDLTNLIKDIRIHYQAPKWLLQDIRSTVSKFGLQPGIVRGSLLNDEY